MSGMSELQYVLERFGTVFAQYKGKKIVLHGTREYAENILQQYDPVFHFTGVMTCDTHTGTFRGKRILNEQELLQEGTEMIILTERVKYAEEAYQALKDICRTHGIRILNMYGIDEEAVHQEYEERKVRDHREWRKLVRTHKAVVYEMLDVYFLRHEDGIYRLGYPDVQRIREMAERRHIDVLFSLRKSYPEEAQITLLTEAGVYSSREEALRHVIRREGEDLSFRQLAEKYDGSVLYICSGLVNEFILPRCYGIDTVRYTPNTEMPYTTFYDSVRDIIRENRETGQYRIPEEEIFQKIGTCDVISFDLFDTLLIRRTLYPRDIQELTEIRTGATGYAEKRRKAEEALPCPDLDGIIHKLAELLQVTEEKSGELLAAEISLEKEMITRREDVCRLYEYARKQGKRIFITTDMYLTEEILTEILEENGIRGYEKIFVSGTCGVLKQNGLFEQVKAHAGTGRILHIGDDLQADKQSAERAGIEACRILSLREAARLTGWDQVLLTADTLPERCLAGLCISELYGKECRDTDMRYAVSACVPVILGYLLDLAEKLKDGTCEKVLFSARDGYLLTGLWEKLREKYGRILPAGQYFYTSRHAAFLPCMSDPANTALLPRTEVPMPVSEILTGFFDHDGAETEETDIEAWVTAHEEELRPRQETALRGALQYYENSGLQKGHTYAYTDFFTSGTTLKLLRQYAPFTLKGYCFGRHLFAQAAEDTAYYFTGGNREMRRLYIEMEAVMTSDEPSLKTYTDTGEPVFQKEVRSTEERERIQRIQQKILETAEAYIRLFYVPGWQIDPDTAEEMYLAEGSHGMIREVYDDWGQFAYK